MAEVDAATKPAATMALKKFMCVSLVSSKSADAPASPL
jgi:hypothetical protein